MKKRYCVLSSDFQLKVFADETKNQELAALDLHYSTKCFFYVLMWYQQSHCRGSWSKIDQR
jgi:hypothetical protein